MKESNKKQRLQRTLKTCLISLSLLFLVNASECKGTAGDAPPLNWNPKLYAGDSGTSSYVRQDGEHIEQVYCSSPDFDKMVVMESIEIRKAKKAYYDVINQCEKWRQAPIY